MTLQDIIDQLSLTPLTDKKDFGRTVPSSGYASDLLSCVMANARHGAIWITLQAHANVVAVGALLELSAIVITEGAQPDPDTLAKANEEGVTLLSTDRSTFYVAGRLWELGIHDN